ncbi:MAG: DNA-binding protein WhiA [Candidatus Sericytochromatia bacterium]
MTSFCYKIKESLIEKDKLPYKKCCWKKIFFSFLTFKNYQLSDNNIIEIKLEEKYMINTFENSLKILNINYKKESINHNDVINFSFDSTFLTSNINELVDLPVKKCCILNWLKIAFLSIGYVSDPNKNYHLELCSNLENIEKIKDILHFEDLEAKYYKKNNESENYILYIKKSDDIIRFLGLIGANKHLLEIENVKIEKEMKNHIIRQINYETANLEKTIESSVKYISAIEWAIENGIFNDLDENLKEVANLRIKYPDKNLRELCDLSEKPLTKSGINHRLRRLYGIIQKEKSKVI